MSFKLWLEANSLRLYHGSRRKFPKGFRLTPQPTGYAHHPDQQILEQVFEKMRPPDKLSRYQSVFLVDDPTDCESAGGYEDHVYLVQPEGQVEKSDLAWYSECEVYLDEPIERQQECAKNYWVGVPFTNPANSMFEYRCRAAIILKEIRI
jgi:hypothetical protein